MLLVLFCVWCRRRGDRDRDEDDEDYWVDKDRTLNKANDYWERRFQALEAGGSGQSDEKAGEAGNEGGENISEVKKIRVSLSILYASRG